MSVLMEENFIFVVDTNSFVDSLINAFSAFCTGFSHESYLDQTNFILFDQEFPENPFQDYIVDRELDTGYSPCCVWLNRKWGIDSNGNYEQLTEENYSKYENPAPFSIGIFFGIEPTKEQVLILKDRAKIFLDQYKIKIEGFRLIKHSRFAEESNLDG